MYFAGPNRYVCDVLKEMREMLKHLDENNIGRYKSFHGMMIEEVQSMVNVMEAALADQKDVRELKEKKRKLKKELKELQLKKQELKVNDDKGELDD